MWPVLSNRPRRARILSLLLSGALVAAACSGSAPAEPADGQALSAPPDGGAAASTAIVPTVEVVPENAIRVGVLMDHDQLLAPLDRQASVTLQSALADLDEQGGLLGRPIVVSFESTTSRLSVVDAFSAKMIDAGVDVLMITCARDFATPALDRAVEAGVLVISPCAGEPAWGDGGAGSLVFSMTPSTEVIGRELADYVWAAGHRRVAVVHDVTSLDGMGECEGFRQQWSALGGSTSLDTGFGLAGAIDLASTRPDIADRLQADAIVACVNTRIGLELLKSIREVGVRTPVIASPALDSGDWLPSDIPDLGDFTLVSEASAFGDDPSAKVAAAIESYHRLDAAPLQTGRFVTGADAVDVWAAAVLAAGTTDGAAVAAEIRDGYFEATSGALAFEGRQAPAERTLRALVHRSGALVFDALIPTGPTG